MEKEACGWVEKEMLVKAPWLGWNSGRISWALTPSKTMERRKMERKHSLGSNTGVCLNGAGSTLLLVQQERSEGC